MIEEHIKKDNKSHIFKHIHSTANALTCIKLTQNSTKKLKKIYTLIGENLT